MNKHEQICEKQEITAKKILNESNLYSKKHFLKNPLHFKINADFEADNEIDDFSIGNKTTNILKQNPVCSGFYIVPELNDVLQTGYYESPLGYDNVDWFVGEVKK